MLKWALIFLIIAVIAGIFGFTYWKRESDFRPLYTSMAPEDAAGVDRADDQAVRRHCGGRCHRGHRGDGCIRHRQRSRGERSRAAREHGRLGFRHLE